MAYQTINNPGAPRMDYLRSFSSIRFTSKTTQKLVVTVPQNQWWVPKIIRVSVSPKTLVNDYGNAPSCQLYYTSAGQTGPGQYLDGTSLGNGDASGLISGTIAYPGEQIIAQWDGPYTLFAGSPDKMGVGYMEIVGLVSNTPPQMGISIPEVMGPHFFGKISKFSDIPAGDLSTFAFNNPGPGLNTAVIFQNLTPPFAPHKLGYLWGQTAALPADVTGYFYACNGATPTVEVARLTQTAAQQGWQYCDFEGNTALTADSVYFHQTSTDAAGSLLCAGYMLNASPVIIP